MATTEQVQKARSVAQEIQSLPIESLLQNPKWGTVTFLDVEPEIRLIVSLANHLTDLPVELVPNPTLIEITNALVAASSALRGVAGFNLEASGNTRETRQGIANAVQSSATELLVRLQGWIGFLAYQKGDVQRNLGELNRAVGDAGKALDVAQKYAAEKKIEVDGIVGAAREAAAKVGVGHFTEDFAGDAVRLDGEATRWLYVTGGLAIVTLAFAVGLTLVGLPKDASTAQVAHLISSKVIVLLVLMTATVWCGRLYKATKHQAVTNHHRANALKTFQAFVKAATDDGTRDAVLLETTRSIFAIAPSGYLDSGEPGIEPASKLMEIIRAPKPAAG